jgi:hypothetical protein
MATLAMKGSARLYSWVPVKASQRKIRFKERIRERKRERDGG